jgi:hypothetical protein
MFVGKKTTAIVMDASLLAQLLLRTHYFQGLGEILV